MGQVRVTYDNGVVVCVNRHPAQTWPVQLGHPGGWFNFNAVMNGHKYGMGGSDQSYFLCPPADQWLGGVLLPT